MEIKSARFGELMIPEDLMLEFPAGLPGFPEETKFALLNDDLDSPFAYLQSANDAHLTFLLVDPFSFFKHYGFELEEQVAADMGINPENPPQIYTIVRVPERAEEMTVNLMAPIVVNWQTKTAAQIVLEKSPYKKDQRLFPFGLPKTPLK